MRFGFSYVGFIYLVMLLVPNLIWAKNKPEDYALYAKNENRILLILERAGEILVSAIVLVCSDFNLRAWTPWCLWLVASFFLMILYELYWYRYFGSWHDKEILVTVCGDKFEYDNHLYRSLSGIARKITGTNWNGYEFFGIKRVRKCKQ